MIATDERPLFGYKNPQLGKMLSDINIPCIDLDKDLHFPRYELYKINIMIHIYVRFIRNHAIGVIIS